MAARQWRILGVAGRWWLVYHHGITPQHRNEVTMPFVKLDCGILDSTLWIDRECREVFITALLMAQPFELKTPARQLETRSTQETGWTVPPGWYGFVEAAGVGIIRRAGIDHDAGLAALDRLGSPEAESRSPDHEGRRLVRVPGGFLVLNFFKYRDRDYTGAERARRYRQRQADKQAASHRDVMPSHRDITQAEAEAEAEELPLRSSSSKSLRHSYSERGNRTLSKSEENRESLRKIAATALGSLPK